mgnify:CR=1 FL=1
MKKKEILHRQMQKNGEIPKVDRTLLLQVLADLQKK